MVKWDKGATYRISTNGTKRILMHKTYYKEEDHDKKIISHEVYRSGWIEVLGDEMPNYLDDTYDPEIGINVWCFPMINNEILDGVIGDFSFSENFTHQEIEKLEPLIAERGIEEIALMGWEFENTEVWFYGDLNIEKKLLLI